MFVQPSSEPRDTSVRRRPEQQRSRERFEALIAAARRLIGQRGVGAVTMTDIAAEADVALTAAYRYFPNKDAVVRELALRSFEADDAWYDAFTDRAGRTFEAWIEDAVLAYCTAELGNDDRLQLRAAIYADPELAELNLEDSRKKADRVADALTLEGLALPRAEVAQRALLLLKLVDGALNLARAVDPTEARPTLERFARLASTLLLDGSALDATRTTP